MNIGDFIKEKRKQKGLTQSQLSEMVEINVTTISRIEKGERKPLSNQIKPLAKALGANLQDMKEYYLADRIFAEYGDNPKILDAIQIAVGIIRINSFKNK